MLSPEAASKQLEQWKREEGEEQQVAVIKKLPVKLREIGLAYLSRKANGEELDWNSTDCERADVFEARAKFDTLSANEQRRLLKTLCGPLADVVELVFEFHKSLPYVRGSERRAFRAPGSQRNFRAQRDELICLLAALRTKFQDELLTPEMLAVWTPYLQIWRDDSIGRLLAAVIDAGGERGENVFEILCQIVRNEHGIGRMARYIPTALLTASRVDGWELMEKTLLAAQRQEGLRQVILEAIDEAHPLAFQRLLKLILEEDLYRFSAVTRAVDVWFGMQWDSSSTRIVKETIATVSEFLEQPELCTAALEESDPPRAYLALWAIAFGDVEKSIPEAANLLTHPQAEMRFVGLLHLWQTSMPEGHREMLVALDDQDLRVAFWAAQRIQPPSPPEQRSVQEQTQLFAALERLMSRLPSKPHKLPPIVWDWTALEVNRSWVARCMFSNLGDLPPTRLIPYLSACEPAIRWRAVELLSQQKKWDSLTRETLLQLIGDATQEVRRAAFDAFANLQLTAAEIMVLEGYLTRKTNDLRIGIVQLLLKQADADVLASADRLTSSKQAQQRLAGLEVLRQLAEADRERTACISRARDYQEQRKKLNQEEQSQLDAILTSPEETLTLENGLGLFDPSGRSPVIEPKVCKVQVITPATQKILTALDNLIHEHRETTVTYEVRDKQQREELLGNLQYGFPGPDYQLPIEPQLKKLPLAEVWNKWYEHRPKALRDSDGCELYRASMLIRHTEYGWRWNLARDWLQGPGREALKALFDHPQSTLKYPRIVSALLDWLLAIDRPQQAMKLCLDIAETALALVPESDRQLLTGLHQHETYYYGAFRETQDWRHQFIVTGWIENGVTWLLRNFSLPGDNDQKRQLGQRAWNLLRFLDEPVPGALRRRPNLYVLLGAYSEGYATIDDVVDHLIGPHAGGPFDSLSTLTSLHKNKYQIHEFQDFDDDDEAEINRLGTLILVEEKLQAVIDRVFDIELARGEAETLVTHAAMAIQSLQGTHRLLRALQELGKEPFKPDTRWKEKITRPRVLTHFVQITAPDSEDSPEEFKRVMKQAVKAGLFPEDKILQLAFLAPQWCYFVETYFGWKGFAEGLYWFLAHMRFVSDKTEQAAHAADAHSQSEGGTDDAAAVSGESAAETTSETSEETTSETTTEPTPQRKYSAWERLIMERTPLSEHERQAGAVDVNWFLRTYKLLGGAKWTAMAAAARFAANPAQAKRAQLIADVLLGKVKKSELVTAIRDRKLKEQVRLLGLLPLATGAKRNNDLRDRYEVLQEYRRYAKGLSSLSRPDAMLASEIGMQNLASLAGYQDPLRLEWAMEAESTQDLAAGPVSVEIGEVSMTLSLDDRAQPQLAILRKGKLIKSLPASEKKTAAFVALRERSADLKKQASRVRQSLEAAMCRGDEFTGAELSQIAEHALLWPLLSRLVLIGEGIAGYPDKNGKVLRDHAGNLEPVKKNERLRIAHSSDLLTTGLWDKWQHECFFAERMQPFKQVFRELYVVTQQERADGTRSRRYAGQQINPQQAFALWGARGWKTEDGVWKTFHELGMIAQVDFDYGPGTSLEVEGLQLNTVSFRDRDRDLPLKLTDVPPRLFSEVMRDLDLVVSVAHRGGVDPEASASTVEMRSVLLRETCELLGIQNVKLLKSHATIQGQLSEYSVHLGSGNVHRMPGGALCIIPVHAQHRGRLFLPFADDDPKTAEVLSKVLLLAHDHEIQDPSILEQLAIR